MVRAGFPKGRRQKKNGKEAVRLTAWGGSPPSSLLFCEILTFIKWQNNPKYDNLSRIFHIFLTASGEGEGGSSQAVSLTAFRSFFLTLP